MSPDLAAALAAHLPRGVIVNGEAIIYDRDAGRTSFTLLQRRLTAGRHAAEEASRHPAPARNATDDDRFAPD